VIGLASIGWRYRKANRDPKNRLSFGAIARLGDIWIAVNDDLRALSLNFSAYLSDPLKAKRRDYRIGCGERRSTGCRTTLASASLVRSHKTECVIPSTNEVRGANPVVCLLIGVNAIKSTDKLLKMTPNFIPFNQAERYIRG